MNNDERRLLLHELRRSRASENELRQRLEAVDHCFGNRAAVADLEHELQVLRASRAYRIGRTIALAVREPLTVLGWPKRLWLIVCRRMVRWLGASSGDSCVAPSMIPFGPQQNERVDSSGVTKDSFRLRCSGTIPQSGERLRLAIISDRFTADNLKLECDALMLTPEGWRQQLDGFSPHLLFVESAWQGLEGEWTGLVSKVSEVLESIVLACRSSGIPTVFWNKEDPLHFEAFIESAGLFDYVFTTDADCILPYRERLGHERIGVLPFAVQPRLHHPIADPEDQRIEGSFFAGAWYGNLAERCQDFTELADALMLAGEFAIYDRNDRKGVPARRYPSRYVRHMHAAVEYEQTPRLYRSYRIGLSLNTIKQSPSMFARRALELICTNTSVYSNFSRAQALLLGDLVLSTDNGAQVLDRAIDELSEPQAMRYRRRRLRAMRKVLNEHTWAARLQKISEVVWGNVASDSKVKVTVVCKVTTVEQARNVAKMAAEQIGVSVELHLQSPSDMELPERALRLDPALVEVHVSEVFSGCLLALWSANDYYGPYYLADLVAARQFAQGEIIGKGAYVRRTGAAYQDVDPLLEYRRVARLACRRAIAPAQFWNWSFADIFAVDVDAEFEGAGLISVDGLSYVENGIDVSIAEQTAFQADDELLEDGASLRELEEYLMAVMGAEKPDDDGREIAGSSLAVLFDSSELPTNVSIVGKGSSLELVSKLRVGQEAALFSRNFSAATLYGDKQRVYVNLKAESTAAFDVYLDALDEAGAPQQRYQLLAGGVVSIGRGAAVDRYRLAVAVRGPYVGYWRGLVASEALPSPMLLPGGGRLLVVVNGYPRNGDLYRNGFVHRRVKLYKRRGVEVDVVWVSPSIRKHSYEFDGVCVTVCDAVTLRSTLRHSGHRAIAVHFVDPYIWFALEGVAQVKPVIAWAHGVEVQSWKRRAFMYGDDVQRESARKSSEERLDNLRRIFRSPPPYFHLVGVSRTLLSQTWEDVGVELEEGRWSVIHNPIDTDLFDYHQKDSQMRLRVLSVRPHASMIYANDLVAETIHLLSTSAEFESMHFTLVGDGPLWDENFACLAKYQNVELRREFVSQQELALLHGSHGIFLVPTRGDSQGVSRDEAMASGLVPVTCRVGAVEEFVDADCAMLCPPDDPASLAQACLDLVRDPALFVRLSAAAARRVRNQSAADAMVDQELEILGLRSIENSGNRKKS